MRNRREFICAVGGITTVSVSGCLSSSEPEEATVEATVDARSDGEEQTIIEDERSIDGGDFYGWEFVLDWEHEINYTVEVTDGPDLGVYILTDEEFDAFQNDEEFEAIDEAVWTDVGSVTDSVTLDEGNYWIVAINADVEPTNA